MSEKKKLFPKLKKKISDFLADESGEITKKDALGIAAGVTILAGIDSVNAEVVNLSSPYSGGGTAFCTLDIPSSHVSGIVNGHISVKPLENAKVTHGSHSNY